MRKLGRVSFSHAHAQVAQQFDSQQGLTVARHSRRAFAKPFVTVRCSPMHRVAYARSSRALISVGDAYPDLALAPKDLANVGIGLTLNDSCSTRSQNFAL